MERLYDAKWIIDVLRDLEEFCTCNSMPLSANAIKNAKGKAYEEMNNTTLTLDASNNSSDDTQDTTCQIVSHKKVPIH